LVDLVLSPDELSYRGAVREFVNGVLKPLVTTRFDFRRTQTRAEISEFRAAISRHEIATTAPLRDDGSVDLIAFGIFIEEVSRLDGAFASLAQTLFFPVWDMASLLVTDEQQRVYGHLFAPGAIVSRGLSEPNAGSNPAQIETTARRTDDGWIINGRKLWTSHAAIANGVLVAARKVDRPGKEVSLFLLDADTDKYDVRTIDCIGGDAIATCEVTLDEVHIPAFAEMTPGKASLRSALHLVEQGRLKIVFQAIGIAQAALDLAVEYAKVRTQGGRPIATFQLVQQMLADMATEVELARLIAYRAASLIMGGDPAAMEISMAKSYATEAAVRVASLGIQVHGGMGLTRDCPAERYLRDARMLTIPDGTTQIHKLIIGRALTGMSAFT
jgi:alkylation response protein AidB-like acyl-CoA dehydrogenase